MTSRRARDSFNLLPSGFYVFIPRDSFFPFFLLRLHSSTLLQSFPIIVWRFFFSLSLFLSFRLAREHFEAGNYDIYIILSLILIFSFFSSRPPTVVKHTCVCVCLLVRFLLLHVGYATFLCVKETLERMARERKIETICGLKGKMCLITTGRS